MESANTDNGYICFYNGKRVEVRAPTTYAAQEKAAAMLGVKKAYKVTVMLAEKDGQTVTHSPASL